MSNGFGNSRVPKPNAYGNAPEYAFGGKTSAQEIQELRSCECLLKHEQHLTLGPAKYEKEA